jgi:peptidoglycan/LPS O-acetylase OafA/YrhL
MKRRIDDIEVLRAIAVIFVCIEHMDMNLFAWTAGVLQKKFFGWTGMWSGVDLFFVISGFVIARDFLPKFGTARSTHERLVTTLSFWIRRAWRLIPSAWLWLGVILCACLFFNHSGAWGSFRANLEGVMTAVFQVANLRAMLVYAKFEPGATFPYWSLSLEEQFYLVLPFLIWLSGKRLPLVLGVVVVLQLVLPRSALGTITRTDALALGVLLAIWSQLDSYRLFEPRFMARRMARFLLIPILLGGLAFAGGEDMHVPVPISLVAYIGAILVFFASYDRNYLMAPGWIKKVFLWVGSRSYAIYLIHIPAYYTTREIFFRMQPPGTGFDASYGLRFLATATVLIIVLAELNYRLVETPLRRRGAEIATRFRNEHLAHAPRDEVRAA